MHNELQSVLIKNKKYQLINVEVYYPEENPTIPNEVNTLIFKLIVNSSISNQQIEKKIKKLSPKYSLSNWWIPDTESEF